MPFIYHEGSIAGDPFCGDIDGVPLGQCGVLPGPTQINCRAFRAKRERSVPPLDPCCRERATLRTPGAVPRTHTHSYLKFGSHKNWSISFSCRSSCDNKTYVFRIISFSSIPHSELLFIRLRMRSSG